MGENRQVRPGRVSQSQHLTFK